MADFTMKANDTLPKLRGTLSYSDLTEVDLTDSTVQFIMRLEGSAVAPRVKSAATILSASSPASVEYDWTVLDTNDPGSYLAEFEVTFPDGEVRTFPTDGYFTIDILADLDQEGA